MKEFKSKFILIYLIILAIFLRFINLENIATFGHDNSRDLILLYKLYSFKEFIYRGPVFSLFWAHLSPIYYYILFPFAFLFNFHPLSISIFTNLISVLTVVLLFFVIKNISNFSTALIAAFIYAISFNVIKESSFGLNPSLMPPFTVLLIFSLYKIIKKDYLYYTILALALAGLVSFHPSGFFVIPIVLLIILTLKLYPNIKISFYSLLIFFVLAVIPYAVQEKKFNLYDVKIILNHFAQANDSKKVSLFYSVQNFFVILLKNISITIFGVDNNFFTIISGVILIIAIYYAYRFLYNKTLLTLSSFFLILYIIPASLIINFYDQGLRSGWFFPIVVPTVVIIFSSTIETLNKYKYGAIFVTFLLGLIAVLNINAVFNYKAKDDSYKTVREISENIRKDSNNTVFNIIGIDPQAYMYYLWYTEKNVKYKSQYYSYIIWSKQPKPDQVYFIEQKQEYTPEIEKELLNTYNLKSSIMLLNDNELKLYKLY